MTEPHFPIMFFDCPMGCGQFETDDYCRYSSPTEPVKATANCPDCGWECIGSYEPIDDYETPEQAQVHHCRSVSNVMRDILDTINKNYKRRIK